MESKYLQLNNWEWRVQVLGENALLLTASPEEIPLEIVQSTADGLGQLQISWLLDIVSAYNSIALLLDLDKATAEQLLVGLQDLEGAVFTVESNSRMHELPLCFDKGLDWDEVQRSTGLTRAGIEKRYLAAEYRVAMLGFLPGFIYLSGLDPALACPRKEDPRVQVPKGAVGVGGRQAGIYSFSSPGGWQIIGQTPQPLFFTHKSPPNLVQPGDTVRFFAISEQEFDNWPSPQEKNA